MEQEKSVFVKINEYKEVVDILNLTREKIKGAKLIIEKINRLKAEENAEIEKWHKKLDDITHRVEFIDQTLMK